MKNQGHLIWAITTILVVAMILFVLSKLLTSAGAQKAELLDTIQEALRRKDGITIKIEIDAGEPDITLEE